MVNILTTMLKQFKKNIEADFGKPLQLTSKTGAKVTVKSGLYGSPVSPEKLAELSTKAMRDQVAGVTGDWSD